MSKKSREQLAIDRRLRLEDLAAPKVGGTGRYSVEEIIEAERIRKIREETERRRNDLAR